MKPSEACDGPSTSASGAGVSCDGNRAEAHSPEPWGPFTSPMAQPFKGYVGDADDTCCASTTGTSQGEAQANARRIIACVNACRDLPTEALEAGALPNVLGIATALGARWSMDGLGRGDERLLGDLVAALRALGRLP